jgi:hypothetical protein
VPREHTGVTVNEQPPGSLGAQLLETYYRMLDEAIALRPARDRRLEEDGYVLPRPAERRLGPVTDTLGAG